MKHRFSDIKKLIQKDEDNNQAISTIHSTRFKKLFQWNN